MRSRAWRNGRKPDWLRWALTWARARGSSFRKRVSWDGGDAQGSPRLGEFHLAGDKAVEGFRQQGGVIVVIGSDGDAAVRAAVLPAQADGVFGGAGLAHVQGQIQAQAEHGDRVVLRLAAPFVGLGLDAGRPMGDHDRGFHLVTMLAAGTSAAGASHVASLQ